MHKQSLRGHTTLLTIPPCRSDEKARVLAGVAALQHHEN